MMKRKDLLREAKRLAKDRGDELQLREGGSHSIIQIGNDSPVSVPRHSEINEINEINEITAKAILKQLNKKSK